jgi:Flp pilus assembly protein TadD
VQNPGWTSARRFLTEILEPSTVGGYYQPLTMISLMADCALGGRADYLRPFHRTSLALHIANTALVIVLLYLLFPVPWVAAAVGLLFGLHPLTADPICWVGERKTLLAAFFVLWSLILYVQYARKNDWKLYLGSMVMYVLALMSKPTSVPLPVLFLLMDYWPLGRLKLRAVLEKLPLFVIGAVSAVITYISQSRTCIAVLPGEFGPARIPLILCHNTVLYLCKIIFPANLSLHYVFPEPFALSNPIVLRGLVGTCILILFLLVSLRWTPAFLISWLFFFIAMLPTMQIISFSNVIAADKYAYLPSVGLLFLLAYLLTWFYCAADIGRPAARGAAVVILVLILASAEAVATRRYIVHWRDSITLQKSMLVVEPDSALLHNNLGILLAAQENFDEAITHFRRALQSNPRDAKAHNNIAMALKSQGRLNQAVGHFAEAVRIEPDFALAHCNFADTFFQQSDFNKAVAHYKSALQIKPHFPGVNAKLAFSLEALGEFDQAVKFYTEALRAEPDRTDIMNNLAWLVATHNKADFYDPKRAIDLAERACQLTKYHDPSLLDTLAAAYAAAGNFAQAVRTAEKAVELTVSLRNEEIAGQIKGRLKLYQAKQPFFIDN